MQQTAVILDAKGKSLGRLSSEAASYLRGKRDPGYERHLKPIQKVIIENADLVRISGKKMTLEGRERYSGYPGGLKKIPYQTLFRKNAKTFMRDAISGMIPRNRLRKNILKNLTIHVSSEK